MRRFLTIAACALLLSGCVWTRLLSLKGQFKEFDRYIEAVDDGPALLMQFKEPCYKPEDIGYLLGDEVPSEHSGPGGDGIETWTYRLRRDRADSIGLDITMRAKEGMVTALRIPPEVMRFIPRERMLAMARAMGNAEIDRSKRSASAGISGDQAKEMAPGRPAIIAALGDPDTSEAQADGITRFTFVFHLEKPDHTLGEVSKLIMDLKGDVLTAVRLDAPRFSSWVKFNNDG